MEVLAGDDNMITTVKENGCSFTFDFSKVYWNSRLHTEHERLIKGLKREDVVLDVFAGVGPFSIPAAKKGCLVYANDLNPHSYESLRANAKANSVTHKLKAYNLDGREFIQKVTHDLLVPQQPSKEPLNTFTKHNTRIIMNLPATAVQFLDTFRGLFSCVPSDHRSSMRLPTIYCYCFSKSEDAPDKDALQMVQRSLGVPSLRAGTYSTYTVRSVAPNKVMMKVTFELPPEVAFFEETHGDGSLQPPPPSSSSEGSNTDVCSHCTPDLEDGSTSLPCDRRKDDMDAAVLSCDPPTDEGRCVHTRELEAAGTRTSGVEGDNKGELHPQTWPIVIVGLLSGDGAKWR
jgi:tRNA (guanine37-N1)-methyltransferase